MKHRHINCDYFSAGCCKKVRGETVPCPEEYCNQHDDRSTYTLRDRFAAAALTGIKPWQGYERLDDVAQVCYALADAMLKAREVKP